MSLALTAECLSAAFEPVSPGRLVLLRADLWISWRGKRKAVWTSAGKKDASLVSSEAVLSAAGSSAAD